ncbi:MAG: large conductance mechanosensitive channel protein MscL [Alphaproteobacteria bacterium]|nr:large conductance mechanosensitive channel protein MscL [Alphaproteobacteria bacterium]
MSFVKDFRDFITRGNVLDLAVGIIIGAAFTSIVSSLVDDVLMPVIGLLLQGIDFSNLFINLKDPLNNTFVTIKDAKAAGVATLNYGLFINAVIKFLIVAFAVFMLVRNVSRFIKKPEAAPATPPAPPEDVVLLREIRDLLKK